MPWPSLLLFISYFSIHYSSILDKAHCVSTLLISWNSICCYFSSCQLNGKTLIVLTISFCLMSLQSIASWILKNPLCAFRFYWHEKPLTTVNRNQICYRGSSHSQFLPGVGWGPTGSKESAAAALGSFTTSCCTWGQRYHPALCDPAPLPRVHSWARGPCASHESCTSTGDQGQAPSWVPSIQQQQKLIHPPVQLHSQHSWRAGSTECCGGNMHSTLKPPKTAWVSFCYGLNYDPIAPS